LDRWERERLVGRQAKVKLLPAQPGESPATCADIAAASRDLGYRPATPLEEGLRRFVEWYRLYRQE
jgi:UDP-glucuronate 4-epimerase